MKKYIKKYPIYLLIILPFYVTADQTGDCTAGSQYCEQNSLDTTNTTTTTNTNTLIRIQTRTLIQIRTRTPIRQITPT